MEDHLFRLLKLLHQQKSEYDTLDCHYWIRRMFSFWSLQTSSSSYRRSMYADVLHHILRYRVFQWHCKFRLDNHHTVLGKRQHTLECSFRGWEATCLTFAWITFVFRDSLQSDLLRIGAGFSRFEPIDAVDGLVLRIDDEDLERAHSSAVHTGKTTVNLECRAIGCTLRWDGEVSEFTVTIVID